MDGPRDGRPLSPFQMQYGIMQVELRVREIKIALDARSLLPEGSSVGARINVSVPS